MKGSILTRLERLKEGRLILTLPTLAEKDVRLLRSDCSFLPKSVNEPLFRGDLEGASFMFVPPSWDEVTNSSHFVQHIYWAGIVVNLTVAFNLKVVLLT